MFPSVTVPEFDLIVDEKEAPRASETLQRLISDHPRAEIIRTGEKIGGAGVEPTLFGQAEARSNPPVLGLHFLSEWTRRISFRGLKKACN